ncbi:hypothetical protein MLD38_027659 [Melastoma candidum]|uniref:Uncharacterized protein n=1 Tax=Melastoma candidum TaxID=119954 RepID=A0ACB9P465_9MYRT|nr:hypothetical protein MLD38_027659 [Melastoma candidum]
MSQSLLWGQQRRSPLFDAEDIWQIRKNHGKNCNQEGLLPRTERKQLGSAVTLPGGAHGSFQSVLVCPTRVSVHLQHYRRADWFLRLGQLDLHLLIHRSLGVPHHRHPVRPQRQHLFTSLLPCVDPWVFAYHIVPQRLTFSELCLFDSGSRLPTLLMDKYISLHATPRPSSPLMALKSSSPTTSPQTPSSSTGLLPLLITMFIATFPT